LSNLAYAYQEKTHKELRRTSARSDVLQVLKVRSGKKPQNYMVSVDKATIAERPIQKGFQGMLAGTATTGLIAAIALSTPHVPFFRKIEIAPAIYAVLIGMLFGNTLYDSSSLKNFLQRGVSFSKQRLLRAGIILYGFRITFQEVLQLGPAGLLSALFIMSTTSILGWFLGTKLLKLGDEVTLLLTSGCSVCGVTAVLATEQVVDAERHQTSMSVATILIFGTISMFLYPILYKYLPFDARRMGIFTGSTVHELAGVIAAGNAMGADVTSIAVVTKLTRVMLLGPYLFLLSFLRSRHSQKKTGTYTKLYVPWFAVGFLGMACVNSMKIVPTALTGHLKTSSVWLLHMALAALGIETNFEKVKEAGFKPILLDIMLFFHLTINGFLFTKFITSFTF